MAALRRASPLILAVMLLLISNAVLAGRSTLSDGYLSVPRIDIDGFGAMELVFRLEFDQQYVLVLEEAVETSGGIANSGVFDPAQGTIEVDEIELPGGKLYSVQLRLIESENQYVFAIDDAVHLNPEAEPASPAPVEYEPSAQALALYGQQCSSCHGENGTGVSGNPSLAACANCAGESALSGYIRDTMPLGQSASCDAACADVLAEYILGAFNSANQQVSGKTIGFIQALSDSVALRRAAQQLVGRLPTLEEFGMVASGGDAGMRQAVQGMMNEEAFYVRLSEVFNDYLLTDKYHSRNGSEAAISLLSSDDFPNRRWFDPGKDSRDDNYSAQRRATNDGVAREPLALINHIVANDLPFTQMLTADYMMVNPYSARTYGIDGLPFKNPTDAGEFLRRQGLHQAQLHQWRQQVLARLERPTRSSKKPTAEVLRVRELERELARKDKALAETAALLVLKKKPGRSGGTRPTTWTRRAAAHRDVGRRSSGRRSATGARGPDPGADGAHPATLERSGCGQRRPAVRTAHVAGQQAQLGGAPAAAGGG